MTLDVVADDMLDIMYTSGTTGHPKGIIFKYGVLLRKVRERGIPYGLTADDRLLITVPLSNVWGMANGLFFAFVHGASLVLQETFDPEESLDLLSRHRCTLYAGVLSMSTDLLDHPRFADTDLSALRIANVSAATVPRDLMDAVRDRLQVAHYSGKVKMDTKLMLAELTKRKEQASSVPSSPSADVTDAVSEFLVLPPCDQQLACRRLPERTEAIWCFGEQLVILRVDHATGTVSVLRT
jgi:acyl-CoA synthetase (AMP-forming)/AMP-acid ligase II